MLTTMKEDIANLGKQVENLSSGHFIVPKATQIEGQPPRNPTMDLKGKHFALQDKNLFMASALVAGDGQLLVACCTIRPGMIFAFKTIKVKKGEDDKNAVLYPDFRDPKFGLSDIKEYFADQAHWHAGNGNEVVAGFAAGLSNKTQFLEAAAPKGSVTYNVNQGQPDCMPASCLVSLAASLVVHGSCMHACVRPEAVILLNQIVHSWFLSCPVYVILPFVCRSCEGEPFPKPEGCRRWPIKLPSVPRSVLPHPEPGGGASLYHREQSEQPVQPVRKLLSILGS